MKKVSETYEIVVCGGGLAGFCAAVAASRLGCKTCIIQNRPVFGGNSSSEIGVTPHGAAAFHAYARETGIISELLIEERSLNHAEIYENGWTNSVWDLVMYNMAMNTPNLSFHLNTDIKEVIMADRKNIKAIIAHTQNAEVELTLDAKLFIDCTGDGLVADRAGCEWRMGSESKDEFNEPHAPEKASDDVMGNSIHFRAKNIGFESPFKVPEWAMHYKDASFFYDQGRLPKDERGGYWWIEIGVPFHTIYDNERIRHELTRHALGVWDWMKNEDPVMKERTKNYVLDWIGQVPGKRESRRIMGEYLITENDILNKTFFEDEVAYGGWFIDLHTPGGLLASMSEPSNKDNYNTFSEYSVKTYCGPYGIPLRALIAKDVDNLFMAGRNISATHTALGTVRVMATTALMGQAVGTAAAISLNRNIAIKKMPSQGIVELKQQLLRDDCFLLNNKNEDTGDIALQAQVTSSSEAKLYGAGPESAGVHHGLNIWRDQPQYALEILEVRKGQFIAVNGRELDTISVCLDNVSGQEQFVEAYLFHVENIWDYRKEPLEILAKTTLKVPVGQNVWVDWSVGLNAANRLPENAYVRLDLGANPELSWKVAGCVIPGHVGVYHNGSDQMRRFSNGATLSFKVDPPQSCFQPENVITGVSRPHRYTNLWRSDPAYPLEQWIQLTWKKGIKVGRLEITFPGHLLREYHAYAPFYRDPQCAKDYRIEIWHSKHWEVVEKVEGNYQRKRVHCFDENFITKKVRVVIEKTNGDPSAAIYEIRCYEKT